MIPFIVLAVGFLMIFLEFYLPGGILGSLGGLVVVASVVLFVMQYDSPIAIILYIAGVAVAIYFLFKFALWRIKNAKPGASIYSADDQEGFVASAFDKNAIGKEGVVETDLKPGGHIIVDGKKHYAISQSGYLTKGSEVVVISGQGESLTVKPKKK